MVVCLLWSPNTNINERHGILNHRRRDCLCNSAFDQKDNLENIKTPYYYPFVKGINRSLVDSPHKGPVKRKAVPCHDIIMGYRNRATRWYQARLTHWGRDKMDAISQTTFSSAFLWMKLLEFLLRFLWNLFLRVQLTIFQHWFRLWLGAVQATNHYLNQWWLVYWRIYASLGLFGTSIQECVEKD